MDDVPAHRNGGEERTTEIDDEAILLRLAYACLFKKTASRKALVKQIDELQGNVHGLKPPQLLLLVAGMEDPAEIIFMLASEPQGAELLVEVHKRRRELEKDER